MIPPRTKRTIEGIWTIESARIIAGVTRIVQDISIAEDLAQDALVIALEKWHESGSIPNPCHCESIFIKQLQTQSLHALLHPYQQVRHLFQEQHSKSNRIFHG